MKDPRKEANPSLKDKEKLRLEWVECPPKETTHLDPREEYHRGKEKKKRKRRIRKNKKKSRLGKKVRLQKDACVSRFWKTVQRQRRKGEFLV